MSDKKLTSVVRSFHTAAKNDIVEMEFDEDARVEWPAGESDPKSFSIVSSEGVFVVTIERLS